MSTLAYAKLTSNREQLGTVSADGVGRWVEVLAALVPAEVLALHAVIISFTTNTVNNATQITAPGTLKGVFLALMALSAGLYWFSRRTKWHRLDRFRIFIPAVAFVGWTMLQKTTAFDALLPNFAEAPRFAIAVIGAAVLGAVATYLSYEPVGARQTKLGRGGFEMAKGFSLVTVDAHRRAGDDRTKVDLGRIEALAKQCLGVKTATAKSITRYFPDHSQVEPYNVFIDIEVDETKSNLKDAFKCIDTKLHEIGTHSDGYG